MPPISPSLQEQGRFSVPFTGQVGLSPCFCITRGMADPSNHACTRQRKGGSSTPRVPSTPTSAHLPSASLHPPFHAGLLHGLSALPEHQPLMTIPQGFLHIPLTHKPPMVPSCPCTHKPQSSSLPEENKYLWPLAPLLHHCCSYPLTGILGSRRPGGWHWGRRCPVGPWRQGGSPKVLLKGQPWGLEPLTSTFIWETTETRLSTLLSNYAFVYVLSPHTSPFLFSPGTLWLWLALPDKPAERASYPFPQDQQQLQPSAGSHSHGTR